MPEQIPQETEHEGTDERRPSWSSIPVLVLYFIIAFLIPYLGKVIGAALVIALLGACLWTSLSRGQYEKLKQGYPGYTRQEYITNSLFYYVLMPWIIIALLGFTISLLDKG